MHTNEVDQKWLFHISYDPGRGIYFFKGPQHQVKYIYQLQNLYFVLSGEELTIKL